VLKILSALSKFLSKRSCYKGSKKEDQKGCFICKKPGHFIVDWPNLQNEKSKDKSKKSTFKSNKIKKQIKQNLMATWEDLDSDSECDKDDADEDAKVVVGLVATVTSEAGPESDSEEENEKCLKAKEKQKSWYLDSGCSRHMTIEN